MPCVHGRPAGFVCIDCGGLAGQGATEPQVYPGLSVPIGTNARAIEELAALIASFAVLAQGRLGPEADTILQQVKDKALAVAMDVRKHIPWAREVGPKERG